MRILPVIDLMNGLVVRGIGGRRNEYRPIESGIAADARPATVADSFIERGFCEAYLADLDAIAGNPPSWNVYRQLLDRGMKLWVDAGLSSIERANDLARFGNGDRKLHRIITGLESIERVEQLDDLLQAVGRERFVFSLDLKHGKPLTSVARWRGQTALQIADEILNFGIRTMIVLDLAGVGEGQGVDTLELCREIRKLDPALELASGGGVRNQQDLQALADAGCDAALVASALHDARLP